MIGDAARRLIGRSSLVRAVVKSRPAQRCIVAARAAGAVEQRARFAVNEICRPGRLATYALRGSPVKVCVRHATRDVDILVEIFARGMYEPPPEVAGALRDRQPRVLDLGGNVGLFGAFAFARLSAASVTSLEPDPENAEVLRSCIEINGLGDRWTAVDAAASTAAGTLRFRGGDFADSRAAGPGEQGTIEVPRVDAVALMPEFDLLKIDIQGGEWPLLRDPRFRAAKVGALVLEWHMIGAGAGDAHAAALQALSEAGMRPVLDDPNPNGLTGVVWARRP